MKNIVLLLTFTALCATLISPHCSFAQTFIDGQMPDTFLAEHESSVNSVAFSPDGNTLASGSYDETIKLWDVATGTLKATLEGHTSWVYRVAFSPDGNTLASGSYDETIKLWDVATGSLKSTLEGHTSWVYSVAFSPDGNTLASGSYDETIKLWDVATGTLKTTLEGQVPVWSVAFSPDGKTVAGGSDDTIKLWDVATGTLKTTLAKTRMSQAAEYFSEVPKGRGFRDSKDIYDRVLSIAFSPDGKTIVTGGRETITFWFDSVDADEFTALLSEFQLINYDNLPFEVYRDGRGSNSRVRFRADKGIIDLWDVASGTLKARLNDALKGHVDTITSVSFSSDGKTIASGSFDRTVRLWDVTRQPKAPKATLSDHGAWVYSVAFSPDGTRLASGSEDGTVRLWTALPPANNDGVVNIADLVEVAQNFGQVGKNNADINGDGIVNIVDLILVAVALGGGAAAPAAHAEVLSMLTTKEVAQWLIEAKQLQTKNPTYLRGILVLEQLYKALIPTQTALLANYPNPFNPETWIPYQLATPADVTFRIYTANGEIVRTIPLGNMPAGNYKSWSRAAYWDGKNEVGEPVASGLYFYTLTAGDFTATRKLLIRK